jgi:hypothetical protein
MCTTTASTTTTTVTSGGAQQGPHNPTSQMPISEATSKQGNAPAAQGEPQRLHMQPSGEGITSGTKLA